MNRLEFDDPNLARTIAALPESERRAVALDAARKALETTQLRDPRIVAALEGLTRAATDDASAAGVAALVTELDEEAWALVDIPDAYDRYLAFFGQARAAAAVGFLFEADATTAASEAIYEARAATGEYATIDPKT